eukprot:15331175-Ditylum_brightwellii.AAC.1
MRMVETIGTKSIQACMVQEHSAQCNILSLGSKGIGKTHVALEFIFMLGYHPSSFSALNNSNNTSSASSYTSYNAFHWCHDVSSRDIS